MPEEYNCSTHGLLFACSQLAWKSQAQSNERRVVESIENCIGDSRRTVEADALGESGANPEQGPLL